MAERNFGYRFSASDDASAVFERAARNLKRSMSSMQGDLDSTASSGKQMAQVLESMAEEVEGEFRQLEQASDRLGAALGDEFEGDVRQMVQQLRNAGLSFEEIEADVDSLAVGMRRLDDAAKTAGGGVQRSAGDAADGLDRMRDSGDQSRSVLANMVGNSTQDLGSLGGVAGTAGMTIGQLAEYATEGNISLAGLAKMAGPMLLLGLGVTAVTKTMESLNARQRQYDEDTRSMTKAILDGASASETLAERMVESGRAMATVTTDNNFGEWIVSLGDDTSKGTADVTGALDRLGMTVGQFSNLANGSGSGIMAWRQEMIAAGVAGDDLNLINNALWASFEQQGQAAAGAAAMQRIGATATEDAAAAYAAATEGLDAYRQRMDEATDANNRLLDGTLARFDANLRAAQAQRDLQDAIQTATGATDDASTASDEVAAAYDTAAGAALAQAAAAAEVARQQSGGALTAQESAAIQVAELQKISDGLDPNSPLRLYLAGYIRDLNATNRSFVSTLEVRTAVRNVYDAGPNPGTINPKLYADGGRPTPGEIAIVGEEGPELWVPDTAGTVIPAGKTSELLSDGARSAASDGAAAGITVNIDTINAFDADEAVRKLAAEMAWSGRGGI